MNETSDDKGQAEDMGALMSGNSCVDLYVHTLWALLKRPIGPYLVQTDQALCASLVDRSERLLDDDVLMPEARRELHEMLGYIRWVQPGLRRGAVDGR